MKNPANTSTRVTSTSLAPLLAKFKEYHGIRKIIAFSGGSEEKVSEVEAIIRDALKKLSNFRIAILTGGTKGGIPEIASRLAREFDLPLIGILPVAGHKYSLPQECFALQITVEPSYCNSYWGDESALFAKLADAAIVIGGGSGTLVEVAHMMKINEKLCKNSVVRLPIFVVPVLGVSGVSEVINFLPFKERVRREVLPDKRIFSGLDAANFIIKRLHLYDEIK